MQLIASFMIVVVVVIDAQYKQNCVRSPINHKKDEKRENVPNEK